MSYIGNEPIVSATRTVTEVSATAGQTVFTANGGYTVGYIDVFLNGAQLQTVDFTATNGTTITLTEAAQVGDVIRLVAWGAFQSANAVALVGNSNITGNLNVSGNLGVGTTSPSQKLDVRGGSMVIDTASAGLNPTVFFDHDNFASGTRNYIQMSRTTEGMIFGVANADRMAIDASGRVTMPYQPIMAGRVFNSQTVNAGTTPVVLWDSHYVNTGGITYSSGRFTATVAGTYLVHGRIRYQDASGGFAGELMLKKNGVYVVYDYSNSLAGYESVAVTTYVSLAVGDYLEFIAAHGSGSAKAITGNVEGACNYSIKLVA